MQLPENVCARTKIIPEGKFNLKTDVKGANYVAKSQSAVGRTLYLMVHSSVGLEPILTSPTKKLRGEESPPTALLHWTRWT